MSAFRCAVITPYYQEDRGLLQRCIDSVKRQTITADHFLIADGYPQDWVDGEGVRHLRLDQAHGDYGNVARGIGALLAAAERYDGITLLDADNWLEADHVEVCLAAAQKLGGGICDYVIARRNFRRPDGAVINFVEELTGSHIDTNCFFFLQGSFHMVPIWALIPKSAGTVGDQLLFQALRLRRLAAAVATKPTVNYHCLYESVYRAAGEQPPPGSKPVPSGHEFRDWLSTLSDRQIEVESRLCGGPLMRSPTKVGSR